MGNERVDRYRARRHDLQQLFAAPAKPDPEAAWETPPAAVKALPPKPLPARSPVQTAAFAGTRGLWPFDAAEAARRQEAAGNHRRTINLGGGIEMELVLIPAGEFVMGDVQGDDDEKPLAAVKIARPFWMGKFEVTNRQYAQFDASHDSRFQDKGSWMFNEWDLGWALNEPTQPVIRVSQKEALAFCQWLSRRTGERVTLPTEAQWEYSCRGGTATPLSYGGLDADFSRHANLADWTIRNLVYDVRDQYPPDLAPRDARFNDGKLVTAGVGGYQPNAWGLHDMHGNVWEWTRSAYRPYPYSELDGRNQPGADEAVVVRGGSWYDRPKRSRSAFRLSYPAWQKVFNVGLRVVIETGEDIRVAAAGAARK